MLEQATMLVKRLQDAGYIAVFAGGAVRDMLLGLAAKDFDICTSALPEQIEEVFADLHKIPVGRQFGVIVVVVDGINFQVATFREDSTGSDGRRPNEVRFVKTLKEDAARRDFTINAMFWDPITNELIDFFDGRKDIERKRIRFVGNVFDRIREDKLRILRAIRFACRLGFYLHTCDEDTGSDVLKDMAYELRNVSRERITSEFRELLSHPKGLEWLFEYGMIQYIIPGIESTWGLAGEQDCEYHTEGDVWTHSQMVVDELRKFEPDNFDLLLAGLLHDIGKPATQKCYGDGHVSNIGHAELGAAMSENICRHWLKLPNETTDFVKELVRMHMKMHGVRKLNDVELVQLMEHPYIDSLVKLQHADAVGRETKKPKDSHLEFMRGKLEEYAKLPEHRRPSAESIIKGRDLIQRNFNPGPGFKTILAVARKAQLNGFFDEATKNIWLDAWLNAYVLAVPGGALIINTGRTAKLADTFHVSGGES